MEDSSVPTIKLNFSWMWVATPSTMNLMSFPGSTNNILVVFFLLCSFVGFALFGLTYLTKELASFPGSTCAQTKNRISILQVMESWVRAGNEATNKEYSIFDFFFVNTQNLKPLSRNWANLNVSDAGSDANSY